MADIERSVHFLRRVVKFIDAEGNWRGPPAAQPNEHPRAAIDRQKLVEVVQFCNDRRLHLDEIQIGAKNQAEGLQIAK